MTDADGLLAAIQTHRAEFEAAGDQAEDLRTLPGATVETLREMGAFWLKTPADLCGTPLDPVDFCDVIEELAYADSSTAWAAMIGAGCCGLAAAGWRRREPGGCSRPAGPCRWSPGNYSRAAPGGRSMAVTSSAGGGVSPAASCTPAG